LSIIGGDHYLLKASGTTSGGTSVTGSYDSATGVLSLSGTDTKANYQTVLNSIRYLSSSDDPTAGGTLTNRAISVTVRDSGGNESNAAISKITLTAVNDAPVNTVPAAQMTVMNAPLVLSSASGNALSVADSDATTVRVTLTSTNGADRFSGLGIPAVNFGPGDPHLAHKQDELVPLDHIATVEKQLDGF